MGAIAGRLTGKLFGSCALESRFAVLMILLRFKVNDFHDHCIHNFRLASEFYYEA